MNTNMNTNEPHRLKLPLADKLNLEDHDKKYAID